MLENRSIAREMVEILIYNGFVHEADRLSAIGALSKATSGDAFFRYNTDDVADIIYERIGAAPSMEICEKILERVYDHHEPNRMRKGFEKDVMSALLAVIAELGI